MTVDYIIQNLVKFSVYFLQGRFLSYKEAKELNLVKETNQAIQSLHWE